MARKRKRRSHYGLQTRRRSFRWWWGLCGLGALTLLAIIILVAGYLWLRGSLPEIDGEVRVVGLDGEVEVIRDDHAIPHIFASSVTHASFAVGFVHAHDRLWQMELQRRVGAGRLSEILGADSLKVDRFLRTLGVYRSAERNFNKLNDETKAILEAYAAGVNSHLNARDGPLPLEFLLISHKPEPWLPADSLVWLKMMAWDLGGNAVDEALRARMTEFLEPKQIAELWPGYPEDGPIILESALPPDLPWNSLATILPSPHPESLGSNNWVLSGAQQKPTSEQCLNKTKSKLRSKRDQPKANTQLL